MTERVSFPLTLNMNDYMKGYEGISNKLYDQEVARMNQYDKKAVEKNLAAQELKKKALEQRKQQKEEEAGKDSGKADAEMKNEEEEPLITDPK